MELRKFVVPEFVVGQGAIDLAGRYVSNYGGEKVLIVTDEGIIKADWLEKLQESLDLNNIQYTVFQNLTPNPKDYEIMEGVREFFSKKCGILVALGGGSPIDCAKGIGIVVSNGVHINSYEGVDAIKLPMPPLICIPTTAGTAADISQFAIINNTEEKRKIAIISKAVVPDVALIDVDLTTTMDFGLTTATGIDALVHAIEAYVSNASSPITDLNALEAIKLINLNLPKLVDNLDNYEARSGMVLGSLLAGKAFSNASLGLVHAMAHSLGGLKDTPHGESNATLLEYVIDYNFDACEARYSEIAGAMGINITDCSNEKVKVLLLDRIRSLRDLCKIPRDLTHLRITSDEIRQLSINTSNDACLATNPKHISIKEIEELYARIC